MEKYSKLSRVFIIMNPVSGSKSRAVKWGQWLLGIRNVRLAHLKKETLMDQVTGIFNAHNIKATGAFTKYRGHATELAKAAVKNKVDAIVVIGGDGTINEVVNGMANTSVILGVIPYGTANVFGISFGIPMNVRLACLAIIKGKTQRVDLGRVNGTYFVCMVGVGFDAFVIRKMNKQLKRIWGALSYVILALWEVLYYRFHPILFIVDNETMVKKGFFLIISNTKYYGGNLIMTPSASPSDGKLDVCAVSGKGFFRLIWLGIQMKRGKIKNSHQVELIQCSSIRIQSFGNHDIHADAEHIGQVPATISVAPNALLVSVPLDA